MRILFLADAVFEDLPGGSRMVANQLAAGLTVKGHEVTQLVARVNPDSPSDEIRDGVRIVRYDGAGQGLGFVKLGQDACKSLWKDQAYDIVHTHFAYAALGPLKSVPQHIPRVRTFHGPWDEEGLVEDLANSSSSISRLKTYLKLAARYLVERDNLRSSTSIITLSDCFRDKAVKRYGIPGNRVTIIRGGTDTQRFKPSDTKVKLKESLDLPRDWRILISVRRLAPRMGLDNLILAMRSVVAAHPETLLLIGGTGPEEQKLKRMIGDLSLNEHVRLIGFIPDNQLASYYQLSDLFILPTTALEGFGLVTTEALSSGLPVIGTPIGATTEILSGLDSRLLTDGIEAANLAAGISRFFDGSWAIHLTPEKLHNYVSDNFTWQKSVDSLELLYQDILVRSESEKTRQALADRL